MGGPGQANQTSRRAGRFKRLTYQRIIQKGQVFAAGHFVHHHRHGRNPTHSRHQDRAQRNLHARQGKIPGFATTDPEGQTNAPGRNSQPATRFNDHGITRSHLNFLTRGKQETEFVALDSAQLEWHLALNPDGRLSGDQGCSGTVIIRLGLSLGRCGLVQQALSLGFAQAVDVEICQSSVDFDVPRGFRASLVEGRKSIGLGLGTG